MIEKTTLVVTSVAAPTECMKRLAVCARERAIPFLCVGDASSPPDFVLDGCDFLSLDAQRRLPFALARIAPERHYARKNIGYLQAMAQGAEFILETDDDNFPVNGFWDLPPADDLVTVRGMGWFNIYHWFGADAWPRGFPLGSVLSGNQGFATAACAGVQPLIWQGLVAGEPDVDAIFRLTRRQRIEFDAVAPVFLRRGVWSPFNSQNTRWAQAAFPLLYLPATCSFRATDIVRGYVALRCLWELDSGVAFLAPTAVQERNLHDLMRDFEDEQAIYLNAARIAAALEDLPLEPGPDALGSNLVHCYTELVDMGVVTPDELKLLRAWCQDLHALGRI